ncbi:hypothetical protein NPIL_522791 [Nephila pilipes]|uniref:Uncharacterized protein n=2 Tax=Nephila pilipes TaxID=299642 RepID=A0A8X6IQU4_NEPPI|nr:hypothetical protein NPIL_522791 [Nephila pilipes]
MLVKNGKIERYHHFENRSHRTDPKAHKSAIFYVFAFQKSPNGGNYTSLAQGDAIRPASRMSVPALVKMLGLKPGEIGNGSFMGIFSNHSYCFLKIFFSFSGLALNTTTSCLVSSFSPLQSKKMNLWCYSPSLFANEAPQGQVMPKESADWNFWPDRLATQSESKSNGCMNLVIRLRAGNRASSTETVRRGIEVTCLTLGNLSRHSV